MSCYYDLFNPWYQFLELSAVLSVFSVATGKSTTSEENVISDDDNSNVDQSLITSSTDVQNKASDKINIFGGNVFFTNIFKQKDK